MATNPKGANKRATAAATQKKSPAGALETILAKGKRAPFPDTFAPMLATLVDKPFDKEGWLYEVKWDGYRAVALCNGKQATIKSRNNKSFDDKFYPILDAVTQWNVNAIVDGEIVVLDSKGRSNFSALQNWRSEADGELVYYLFDVMWLNGRDLTHLPLHERRAALKEIIPSDNELIRLSETFELSGHDFMELARQMDLEGIIAKDASGTYAQGLRSKAWLKIKANKRQEMVIGGYTVNDDTSKRFSSLLVGVYNGDRLVYTGKVGTGFTDAQQKEMMQLFKPLASAKPPFTEIPDINKPSRFRPNPPNASVVWLKPKLVCEVSYAEMTNDGIMRHPSFEGMRTDKDASDVVREKAVAAEAAVKQATSSSVKLLKPRGKSVRKTLLNPTDEAQTRVVNGHELKFSNLSKVYWPGEGITKRDLLNYYYRMAPFILPYLKDRPHTLLRHPNGIDGKWFYQKDVSGKAPDWIETYEYFSEADSREKKFMVASDEASLLWMASLGCIEMNPWSSRIQKPDHPDWCIIDLDPADNTFDQVIEAAQVTRQVLESMGITGYPKTSGSSGIHIYIPLGAKYVYEQSKEFARIVATEVHRELPSFTSIERIVKARRGKMYVDFLQNRPQATVSSAYALRPKPGATVSMPLHWDEVKRGLKMTNFTIHNAVDRVRETGDIFKPVLGKGIDLEKVLERFQRDQSRRAA